MARRTDQFEPWRAAIMPDVPPARPRIPTRAGVALALTGILAGVSAAPYVIKRAPLRMVARLRPPPYEEPSTGRDWTVVWDLSRPQGAREAFTTIQRASLFGVDKGALGPLIPVPSPDSFQIEFQILEDGGAPLAENRWFVQRNAERLEPRSRPWPVWIESPKHDEIIGLPAPIVGHSYKSGFVQIRIKPKRWDRYYTVDWKDPSDWRVKENYRWFAAGEAWDAVALKARLSGLNAEAFELYVLFAAAENEYRENPLPTATQLSALPWETGRIEVVGPVEFLVRPPSLYVRTDEELRKDLTLIDVIGAQFTDPDQSSANPTVVYEHLCSGTVSEAAQGLNLKYVLGVRFGDHIWIQPDPPWTPSNGRFDGKIVRFGMDKNDRVAENKYQPEFELWLIAQRQDPHPTVKLEDHQLWYASALPEGCVRAAWAKVRKIATPEE